MRCLAIDSWIDQSQLIYRGYVNISMSSNVIQYVETTSYVPHHEECFFLASSALDYELKIRKSTLVYILYSDGLRRSLHQVDSSYCRGRARTGRLCLREMGGLMLLASCFCCSRSLFVSYYSRYRVLYIPTVLLELYAVFDMYCTSQVISTYQYVYIHVYLEQLHYIMQVRKHN